MDHIALRSIRIRGFKSFTNDTVISFDDAPGLRFLMGRNLVEPELGANGAGKTTIWDAFIWCCTGLSIKGKRASDLVSWGQAACQVAVELAINDTITTITRASNPEKIWIDKTLVKQPEVDKLLGLSRKRLLQSVIFGQGARLFYDMDNAGRGELLDEVLDLGIWLKLADLVNTKKKENLRLLGEAQQELSYTNGRIDGLPPIEGLRAEVTKWDNNLKGAFEAILAEIAEREAQLDNYKTVLADTKEKLAALRIPDWRGDGRINELAQAHGQHAHAFNSASKMIEFYAHTKVCPECQQDISAAHARERIARFELLQEDADERLKSIAAEHEALLREKEGIQKEAADARLSESILSRVLHQTEIAITNCQTNIERLMADAERMIDTRENPYLKQLKDVEQQIALLEESKQAVQATIAEAHALNECYDYWITGFKRVRLWQINRILAVLEFEVEAAATRAGLYGWKIKFVTEIENKSGNMKPGIHIQISSVHSGCVWNDQSGGEEQRVRTAIAIGFANMIQRMSGVHYGFEVWDEPSNWLSERGIEDLLTNLYERAHQMQRVIWLVDHRMLSAGSFNEVWEATKTEKGTSIKRISGSY